MKGAAFGVEAADAGERGAERDGAGRGKVVQVHEAPSPDWEVGSQQREQRPRIPGLSVDARGRGRADLPRGDIEPAPPVPRIVRARGADVRESEPAAGDLERSGHEIPHGNEQAQVGIAP